MGMYKETNPTEHNIEINNIPFYIEEYSTDESYNRRETVRTPIMNGTQEVTYGQYIPRTFEVITHILIDPDTPDMYDDVFREFMSGECEILAPDFGGLFNAEVVVKKERNSPSSLKLTFKITEIPGETSLIPGDSV